jgi:hypothetical protein
MGHASSAARNELPREAERVAIRPRLHVARPGRTRREHGGGTAMGAECTTCCARLPVRSCIQHAEPCGVGGDSGRVEQSLFPGALSLAPAAAWTVVVECRSRTTSDHEI